MKTIKKAIINVFGDIETINGDWSRGQGMNYKTEKFTYKGIKLEFSYVKADNGFYSGMSAYDLFKTTKPVLCKELEKKYNGMFWAQNIFYKDEKSILETFTEQLQTYKKIIDFYSKSETMDVVNQIELKAELKETNLEITRLEKKILDLETLKHDMIIKRNILTDKSI